MNSEPNKAAHILTLLDLAAVFLGTALTIRDLVLKSIIVCSEQAVGPIKHQLI